MQERKDLSAGNPGNVNWKLRSSFWESFAVPIAAAVVAAIATSTAAGAAPPQGSAPTFDRAAWQTDFAFLKSELEKNYSHLAWFASPESGADLPALDRRTRLALDQAQGDAEARLAIRDFATSLHDGHFSELPALEAAPLRVGAEPPRRDLTHDKSVAGCAALGYGDRSQVAFSLPFESLPGFMLDAHGANSAFRTGMIALEGKRLGILRIKNFSQRQYAGECARAWVANPKLPKSDPAFEDRVTDAWFEALAQQLARFRAHGVQIVIVDVGSNSGGNDSGDWAARLFTAKSVRSARLLMTASPVAEKYLSEQIEEITKSQSSDTSALLHAVAQQALGFLTARKTELAGRQCDMSWVWRDQRFFDPKGCTGLIDVGFASGAAAALSPESYRDRRAAASIYWPARVDSWLGAWRGPVYVLTNSTTYSSAEMFAAVMRDNGVAKIVGARTGGDGCGFMEETEPVVLPHSRLHFRVPNCVRLRADGTDEVAGVDPDLPISATEGESARARAVRLLTTVASDANDTAG